MTPKKLPDFSDTAGAFAHMDNKALKRRYSLFKKIDSPFLTKIGPPLIKLGFKLGLPIKGIVRKTVFDIFCGGEYLEDTVARSELLDASNVKTILDYSVEGEKSDEGFDATMNEIISSMVHGWQHKAVGYSAMKVTGIAQFDLLAKRQAGAKLTEEEQASLDRSHDRLDRICRRAVEMRHPIFIDAEETWIQDVIDEWAEEIMEVYNREKPVIYTTVQMYRHDRLEYLSRLIDRSREKGFYLGVKVVRGAYLEKERDRAEEMGYPDPIQPDKEATDRDFDDALRLCLDNIDMVGLCCGSHNEKSNLMLAQVMQEKKMPNDHPHVLSAQLLGMSDHISFNLARGGYRVAKYLPYGPVSAVLPYLFRRAEENTSVKGQSSREMELLKREVKRRKNK